MQQMGTPVVCMNCEKALIPRIHRNLNMQNIKKMYTRLHQTAVNGVYLVSINLLDFQTQLVCIKLFAQQHAHFVTYYSMGH